MIDVKLASPSASQAREHERALGLGKRLAAGVSGRMRQVRAVDRATATRTTDDACLQRGSFVPLER